MRLHFGGSADELLNLSPAAALRPFEFDITAYVGTLAGGSAEGPESEEGDEEEGEEEDREEGLNNDIEDGTPLLVRMAPPSHPAPSSPASPANPTLTPLHAPTACTHYMHPLHAPTAYPTHRYRSSPRWSLMKTTRLRRR